MTTPRFTIVEERPKWTTVSVTLTCGHEQWFFDTTAPIEELDDETNKRRAPHWFRKDGWYAAHHCKTCRRKRAVTSLRMQTK